MPVISHEILVNNRARTENLADGIVTTRRRTRRRTAASKTTRPTGALSGLGSGCPQNVQKSGSGLPLAMPVGSESAPVRWTQLGATRQVPRTRCEPRTYGAAVPPHRRPAKRPTSDRALKELTPQGFGLSARIVSYVDTIIGDIEPAVVDFGGLAAQRLLPIRLGDVDLAAAVAAKVGRKAEQQELRRAGTLVPKLCFEMLINQSLDLDRDAAAPARRTAATRLADELERILRDMLAAAQAKTTTPFPKAASTYEPAFFFKRGETLAQFGLYDSERESYSFAAPAPAFLRLFPTSARKNIGRAKLLPFFEQRRVPMMSRLIGGLAAQKAYGSIIIDPIVHSQISALTQVFPTGELWGVTSKCFGSFTPRGLFEEAEPLHVVAMIDFEDIFQKALSEFIAFAPERLQIAPPFTVIAGASGLKHYSLAFPSRQYNGRDYARLHQSNYEKTYDLPRLERADLNAILRDFFEGFWDLAGCSRAASLTDETVQARGLLPRQAPSWPASPR